MPPLLRLGARRRPPASSPSTRARGRRRPQKLAATAATLEAGGEGYEPRADAAMAGLLTLARQAPPRPPRSPRDQALR